MIAGGKDDGRSGGAVGSGLKAQECVAAWRKLGPDVVGHDYVLVAALSYCPDEAQIEPELSPTARMKLRLNPTASECHG